MDERSHQNFVSCEKPSRSNEIVNHGCLLGPDLGLYDSLDSLSLSSSHASTVSHVLYPDQDSNTNYVMDLACDPFWAQISSYRTYDPGSANIDICNSTTVHDLRSGRETRSGEFHGGSDERNDHGTKA